MKRIILLVSVLGTLSLLASCRPGAESQVKAAEPETIKAGAKVPAILMQTLESGISEEGDEATLMVTEDIKGEGGKVAIPKGALVKARVAWSRREGALDGLLRRPARLHLDLEETAAVDGTKVPLAADSSLDPEETVELNRANTGEKELSPAANEILNDPANEEALKTLASLLEKKELEQVAQTPEAKERLIKVAEGLGLKTTAVLAKEDKLSNIEEVFGKIGTGSLLALTTGQAPLALDAAIETAQFVSSVPTRLSRIFRGRNIKAYVGTPVEAYVAKDVAVQAK